MSAVPPPADGRGDQFFISQPTHNLWMNENHLSPLTCKLGLSPDAPLIPLDRTHGRLPALCVDSGMFHGAGRPPVVRVCFEEVFSELGGSRVGSASPLAARFRRWPLRTSGGPVTAVPLVAPRAAWRATFTHSGHFELTLCRFYLHRFGFLQRFCRRLRWFRLDNLRGRHLYFSSCRRPVILPRCPRLLNIKS